MMKNDQELANTRNQYTRRFRPFFSILTILSVVVTGIVPVAAIDKARLESRTDLAVERFNATGAGVIVAILDRGIDWTNQDFRNEDGTTRIKYIFDLSNNSGANAPGNTYGRGTIFTEAQINAALASGTTLAPRDAVGHGTTTTALAAGNGRNSTNRRYRGIAPEASIITVKVASEGAPAHGNQPAEAVFNDYTAYPVGIDFVRDKSIELGMPAVMLLNLGSLGGPSDASTTLARKIDATVGPGKPGIVFVTGPGDDGGEDNHAVSTVVQGQTTSLQIQKDTAGTLRMDLWYPGTDRYTVSLQTPAGNFGPYAPPNNGAAADTQNATFRLYHRGTGQVFFGSNNGKRELLIDIIGPAGTYTVDLLGTTAGGGHFNAVLNPSRFNVSNRFLNHLAPGSVWEGASALYNISPNSYVVETNWFDINGIPRAVVGTGSIGQLWSGSSVGPTFDGRLGVDLSAPGDLVMTTYNPTSYWSTFPMNLVQGGGGLYGRAGAVSAAAPQVTGLIALLLQKKPNLDAVQVRDILRQSARSDSFTGTTPNPTWGHGKMDTYNALALVSKDAPFDFDGDGKTDVSIFRPTGGSGGGEWWYLRSSDGGNRAFAFGDATDEAVPSDYTGDGKTDIAFWRPATGDWFILRSEDSTFYAFPFGSAGDVPMPADFDGDGKTDQTVFRPSTNTWFTYRSSDGQVTTTPFGAAGDLPVAADYDGDGKADIAIYRPNGGSGGGEWWYLRSSDGANRAYAFGTSTDRAVPGDYTGDGKADLAFWRPSTGDWFVLRSEDDTFYSFPFGISTDVPVPGDYDGDGKADAAVFRPSNNTWYLLQSTAGVAAVTFGATGDQPLPNSYVR